MEWDRLKTFYYVGKYQSFKKASEVMGIAQSSISRSISLLEHQLKTTLFIRHHSGITFTKSGKALFEVAQEVFVGTEKVKNEIWEDHKVPKGELIISATQGIVNYFLTPFLPEFQSLYPDINLSIFARDCIPDFESGHADIALCPPNFLRKDLEQKLLLTNNVVLYASPEYLEKYGIPKIPQDLDHHKLIGIGNFPGFLNMNWHLTLGMEKGKSREPYFSVSSPQSRLFMAERGSGITAISKEHPGLDKMNLIQVLPHIKGPVIETWLMYPEYLKTSKRVQAFENFIIPRFQKAYNPG